MEEYLIETQEGQGLRQDIAIKIFEFEKKAKEIKQKEDELKKIILEEMEAKNITKLEDENMSISYVAPTTRETFDSKTFKNDFGELYDNYVKITSVKSSIRIKLK
jgi:hypothetical protein|nr:MAG TPA_asm: hypothetical protein [Caudoviricetes sp.]